MYKDRFFFLLQIKLELKQTVSGHTELCHCTQSCGWKGKTTTGFHREKMTSINSYTVGYSRQPHTRTYINHVQEG